MRKYSRMLMATFMTVCTVAIMSGCENSDKNKANEKETITEAATNVVDDGLTNNITYETDGDPITDSSVFGDNVFVFSPEDDITQVQEKVDSIYSIQETNQFGAERFAVLFMPGVYDTSLAVNVGYYTTVAGLGINPTETVIQKLWVNADWMHHNATCNFWRGAENFTVSEFCMWANSQAVSLRKMYFKDSIVLSDGEGWSSGGFIADTKIDGTIYSGSQQQYLSRNNSWYFWEGGVWNMVFAGINPNTIPTGGWPYAPYTKVEELETTQEKPYIVYDEEYGYGVFVPEERKNSQGISWQEGSTGKFISLNKFYIAREGVDDSKTINAALAEGKHIMFTPGVYEIEETLKVENPDTIIYGFGLATLVSANGNVVMETADVDGIMMCGLIFEAGNTLSTSLLNIGTEKTDTDHSANPTVLSDLYFRVGGSSYVGMTEKCVEINTNNVMGDNFWVWRADHGSYVAWNSNIARNGIIINGDNVTMYGLFVEHFQQYQTIWNGNGGKLIFYQSEIPYDVPSQEVFMSHDGTVNGFASYKVGDDVTSHEAWGLGVYSYNRDAVIDINSGIEVPDIEGVKIHNAVTVVLNGNPGISHVINNSGNAVQRAGNTARIMEYENGLIE